MKGNLTAVIKQYENQKCFQSDFLIESKARKAYSGEQGPLKQLLQHLELNHPGQVDFIETLKKHLLPEPELTQVSEPILMTEPMAEDVSESEPIQEPLQESKPTAESELDTTHKSAPEATEEQVGDNDTSSQERQYHAGQKYEINPNDKVEIHPAADTMPRMDNETLAQLAEDIKNNEQTERVQTQKGKLIDGRNRLEACRLLGIPVKAKEIADTIDAVTHVISLNIKRRQLSKQQRATAAVLLIPKIGKIDLAPNQKTRDVLGEQFGVSPMYIQYAKAVFDKDEDLFDKVHNGNKDLNKAYNRVKHKKENTANSPVWISSFINILNMLSEDKSDDLRVVLNSSKGKAKNLIQTRLNTFIKEDFDTQTENIDTKIMEENNEY